jgi:GH24 family phage-related lysozyme (muramidase)
MGVTEAARKAVKASKDTPDHEVAAAYLELLESKFAKNMPGFEDAPEQAKAMLLDAGYNMGEQVTRFSGVKAAMERGDYREAGLNLLDTANVDGQTVRGVALRRAESFNLLGEEQIAFVEQLPDGTIKYLDESDNVIFQYKTPKGRHPKSAAIKSPVMTENRLLAMNEGSNLFVKALEMFAQ